MEPLRAKKRWKGKPCRHTYRGCGITFLNRGGNSSHATCEAVKKVSGGGKGCSQGKIARNNYVTDRLHRFG
ncbi:hypothetical protein D3Z60_26510 [Lachnospiraceae bacterium]|nr:hypothetical protein [Lachnospiraceae bacterium]